MRNGCKKIKANFKNYDVTDWETNNYNAHIAQYLKFGWLREFSMGNTLEKLCKNGIEKLVPDPFIKTQNSAYLWINSLKYYTVCFYCMSKWRYTKIS